MPEKPKKTTPKKPEAPAELISNIAEASRNARSIYILYSVLLAYCAVTIVGTSDRQIVLNEPTVLPVFGVNVSLVGFFLLAPLLALFFFVYLQLYLHKLKRLLDDLRINFKPITESRRIYPWMLNFADELGRSGFVARTQRFIVNFSIWWSLPMVLMLLSAWYLKAHDLLWGSIIGIVPLIGALVVTAFWQHYQQPAEYRFKFDLPNFKSFLKTNRDKQALLGMVLLYEILFFALFVPSARKGEPLLGAWPCVNLSYQNLTHEERFRNLYWLNLGGAQLQGGNFTGAVLKKADLRNANLRNANFTGAILDTADLRDAKLPMATLTGASLRGAQLDSAVLAGAQLRNANLDGAVLRGANFRKADLFDASLKKADLSYAMIPGAIFRGARLDSASLFGIGSTLDSTTDFRGAVMAGTYLLYADNDSIFGDWSQSKGAIPKLLKSQRVEELELRSKPLKPDSILSWEAANSALKKKKLFDRFENPIPRDSMIVPGFELQQGGKVVIDTVNGLMWQQSGSDNWMFYRDVEAYINKLNEDRFAGFAGWRLPTLEEAMSLMDPLQGGNGFYINPVFNEKQPWIWTSDKTSASAAWNVSFNVGYCYLDDIETYDCFVRAVRSGQSSR